MVQLKGNLIHAGNSYTFSLHLACTCVCDCACTCMHTRQRITVTGNDTGFSHLPQFFMLVCLISTYLLTYIDRLLYLQCCNVTHWPNLYPYGSIVLPCLAWKSTQKKDNWFSYINYTGHSILQTDKERFIFFCSARGIYKVAKCQLCACSHLTDVRLSIG